MDSRQQVDGPAQLGDRDGDQPLLSFEAESLSIHLRGAMPGPLQ